MIDLQPTSAGDTLVFQASGILNMRDYEVHFAPKVEKIIEDHGQVNLVLHLDDMFEGWSLGAMWDDARFGVKHRHDFNRVAVVGAQTWFKWAMQLGSHIMDGEFKTFETDEFEQAVGWAKGTVKLPDEEVTTS